MSLQNPNFIYTIIYEAVAGKRVDPALAALWLDRYFHARDKSAIVKRKAKITVVLIDELDALMTQK